MKAIMLNRKLFLILTCIGLAVASAQAQKKPDGPKLNWSKGPTKAKMQQVAELDVPAGYAFLDGKDARTILKAMGNFPTDQEVGFLAPTSMVWFVVFEFDPVGYVKDDDKDKLDADKMLASVKKGTEHANKEREKMGVAPLNIIGWDQPPHYNAETHNLEWSIRAESEGEAVVNHNTRLLGRRGVMRVTLVGDPKELAAAMPDFKNVLAGYTFQTGNTYAEYKQGDKIAKYGLAALVVGGAAVGAAKLGLFAWLAVVLKKGFKVVIIAVVAVAVAIKKFFGKLFGGGRNQSPTMQ
jgi:uncharacterized membrane-anchored protein